MADPGTLSAFWDDVKSYLDVAIEVTEDTSSNSGTPLLLDFTVTNTAQPNDERPDIIFEEVLLKVGIPPAWKETLAKNLAGGYLFKYRYTCGYADLKKVQYNLSGKLAPVSLLGFRQKSKFIPATPTLTAAAYRGFLNESNINKWVDDIFKKVTVPGPGTTAAEVETVKAKLKEAEQDVAGVRKILIGLFGFVKTNDKIRAYEMIVDEYLRFVEEGCVLLSYSLSHPSRYSDIAEERDTIIVRLAEKMTRLKAAEALL